MRQPLTPQKPPEKTSKQKVTDMLIKFLKFCRFKNRPTCSNRNWSKSTHDSIKQPTGPNGPIASYDKTMMLKHVSSSNIWRHYRPRQTNILPLRVFKRCATWKTPHQATLVWVPMTDIAETLGAVSTPVLSKKHQSVLLYSSVYAGLFKRLHNAAPSQQLQMLLSFWNELVKLQTKSQECASKEVRQENRF